MSDVRMTDQKQEVVLSIFTMWRGNPEYAPEDTPKVIIEPPDPKIGRVAGIKVLGHDNWFMNTATAKELCNALQKAIEIAKEMDR